MFFSSLDFILEISYVLFITWFSVAVIWPPNVINLVCIFFPPACIRLRPHKAFTTLTAAFLNVALALGAFFTSRIDLGLKILFFLLYPGVFGLKIFIFFFVLFLSLIFLLVRSVQLALELIDLGILLVLDCLDLVFELLIFELTPLDIFPDSVFVFFELFESTYEVELFPVVLFDF